MKVFPCSAFVFMLCACTPSYQPENEIPWSEVPSVLQSCKVHTIWQTHDHWVGLKLDDGTEVVSRTPELDDIFDIFPATPGCNRKILIAIE